MFKLSVDNSINEKVIYEEIDEENDFTEALRGTRKTLAGSTIDCQRMREDMQFDYGLLYAHFPLRNSLKSTTRVKLTQSDD